MMFRFGILAIAAWVGMVSRAPAQSMAASKLLNAEAGNTIVTSALAECQKDS